MEDLKKVDIKSLSYSIILNNFIALGGSIFYLAPELWTNFNNDNWHFKYNPLATDIYSLGIVILELFLG